MPKSVSESQHRKYKHSLSDEEVEELTPQPSYVSSTLYTPRNGVIWAVGGMFLFFILCFILITYDTADRFSWTEQSWIDAQTSPDLLENKYTLRMNTFRRNQRLRNAVEHFAKCERVHSIQIIWSDLKESPPKKERFFSPLAASKSVFEVHPVDSLNNRFNALLEIETDAVFSIDDDLRIDCKTLDAAFFAWKSTPDTLVGFAARAGIYRESLQRFVYESQWWTWWNGWYNIVLTKACFVHKRYVQGLYMKRVPPEFLKFIDSHMNCEDIAMQFVVSDVSKSPPVWFKGYLNDFGGDGISSDRSHFEHRGICVTKLVELYGKNPLHFSNTFVLQGSKGWSDFVSD